MSHIDTRVPWLTFSPSFGQQVPGDRRGVAAELHLWHTAGRLEESTAWPRKCLHPLTHHPLCCRILNIMQLRVKRVLKTSGQNIGLGGFWCSFVHILTPLQVGKPLEMMLRLPPFPTLKNLLPGEHLAC